ncbi:MAG: hypothetical protein K5979_10715 [Ruminococcus sp.]|jgi:hypothetical protein|nr:hypothetical protein [Ruminococcus sp.]
MKLTAMKAYELAKNMFEEFIITSCYELDDCWIFIAACDKSKNAVFIPPLKILKNGEDADFWEKKFESCFERSDWLKENGKRILVKQIESDTKDI